LKNRVAIIPSNDKFNRINHPTHMTVHEWTNSVAKHLYRESRTLGMETAIFHQDGCTRAQISKFVDDWIGDRDGIVIELSVGMRSKCLEPATYVLGTDEDLNFAMGWDIGKVFQRRQKNVVTGLVPETLRMTHDQRHFHSPAVLLIAGCGDVPGDAKAMWRKELSCGKLLAEGAARFFEQKSKREKK
jgi:hypothetical protein